MNQPVRPNPAQLPTLTEVIELVTPTPVADAGMNRAARPAPPEPGSPAAAPIVTGGLASTQAAAWTPMTTVVVPTLREVATPPIHAATLDLPVLEAVVPEAAVPVQPDVSPPAQPMVWPPRVSVPAAVAGDALAPVAVVPASVPTDPVAALPDISEAQLTQRVLGVVQKQIDGMIDFRLKEAMAPIMARHTDALVRELREELSRTMADVIARSVAQEMAKLRQR